jgi:hypothetical protein
MMTKRKVLVAMAILCVIVLTVFVASQLHAFNCKAMSACGICVVSNCGTGGCVEGASAHWCLCDGEISGANCAEQ